MKKSLDLISHLDGDKYTESFRHFRNRLQQRYKLSITKQEYLKLRDLAFSTPGRYMEGKKGKRTLVKFKEQILPVVYDVENDVLLTVLLR